MRGRLSVIDYAAGVVQNESDIREGDPSRDRDGTTSDKLWRDLVFHTRDPERRDPSFVYVNRCTPPPLIPIVLTGRMCSREREREGELSRLSTTPSTHSPTCTFEKATLLLPRITPRDGIRVWRVTYIFQRTSPYYARNKTPLKFFIPYDKKKGQKLFVRFTL